MKKLLLILLLIGSAFAADGRMMQVRIPGPGGESLSVTATPTWAENSVTAGSSLAVNTSSYELFLPNLSGSGNCILGAVAYSSGSGATVTIADNKSGGSNTYTVSTVSSAQSSRVIQMFRATNVGAANHITVTFTGGTPQQVKASASEFYNCATASPLDTEATSTGANGSTTGIAAGSITPAVSGDLLYACYSRTQTPDARNATPYTVGSQSNITWQLINMTVIDGLVCQWGVYNSTSAINPTMSWAVGSGYAAGVLAIKPATAGTAPSGMHIGCVQHEQVTTALSATTPLNLQFAACGNTLTAQWIGGSGGGAAYDISSITDGNSNTWAKVYSDAGCTLCTGGAGAPVAMLAKGATTTGAPTLVINTTGGGSTDSSLLLEGVVGAHATNPLAAFYKFGGTQPSTGNTNVSIESQDATATNGVNFTTYPGTDNGLVLGMVGVAFETITGITTPANYFPDATYYGGQSLSGPSNGDQNNGWFHGPVTADTGVSNYTITPLNNSVNIGLFAAGLMYLRSPTGTVLPTRQQSKLCASTGTGTTVACAFTPKAAGDLVMVGCARGTTTGTQTLTDTAGNTLTSVDGTTNITNGSARVYKIVSVVATANTFTCTSSTSTNTTRQIWIDEFIGVTDVDGSQHALSTSSTSSGTATTSSVTTSVNNEIIWSFTLCSTNCDMGVNQVLGGAGNGNLSSWKFAKTAGSFNMSYVDRAGGTNTEGWAIVALKP